MNCPPPLQEAARAAATAQGPVDFFPEDALCAVCEKCPLYSHSARLNYCCGTALCRACLATGESRRRAAVAAAAKAGRAAVLQCPFCEKALPGTWAEAEALLRAHTAAGAAWAAYELAVGAWTDEGSAGERAFTADPEARAALIREASDKVRKDGVFRFN